MRSEKHGGKQEGIRAAALLTGISLVFLYL